MARKTREIWTSDVIPSVEFENGKDQANFDKKIQSKDWYIETAKDCLEDLSVEELEVKVYFTEDKKVKVDVYFALSEYIKDKIYFDGVDYSSFRDILDDIARDEDGDFDYDVVSDISDYVIDKINTYSDEIDDLLQVA